MQDIGMQIGAIPDMDTLRRRSDLNKRRNYSEKVRQYINGTLPESEKCIDWSKAARDYDFIPWAEGLRYEELWKQAHGENAYYADRPLEDGFLALEIIVGFQSELDIDVEKWARIQYDWFCQEFGESGILSAMLHLDSESYPHCHLVIYSTDGEGRLTGAPCMRDGLASEKFISRYESDMEKYGLDRQTRMRLAERAKRDISASSDYYLATVAQYVPENPRTELDDCEYAYDTVGQLSQAASALPFEQQEEYLDQILNYFARVEKRVMRKAQTGEMDRDEFFRLVKRQLQKIGVERSDEMDIMMRRVDGAVYGNYVLDPLLDDDSISDIKVISPYKIRVKRYGRRLTSNLCFRDEEDYWRFLEGIAARNHTDLSPLNAVQNFTDKYSNDKFILRFNICTNFVNSVPYPYLHIRKVPKAKRTVEDLIHLGMMDMKTASYLMDRLKNGRGMLFTGKGASGKTTIMNTLLDCIPFNNSGLVIQENEELFTDRHPDLMFQHVVASRRRGEVGYDLKDLARNGLLTDLDYFIIGEIKGGEALYFLNAAYTGHKCLASCHGASATQALNKLADYVKYESDYSREDCLKMLQAMEVVVFMKNFKVAEIAEIIGWNEEKRDLDYRLVYKSAAL